MLLFSKIWKTGIATEPLQTESPGVGGNRPGAGPEEPGAPRPGAGHPRGRRRLVQRLRARNHGPRRARSTTWSASACISSRRPRHADLLLVTGPVTRNMEVPLRKTYEATPDPKFVVAIGDCARTCGVFKGAYGVVGPVDAIIPVDVFVAGCPRSPTTSWLESCGRSIASPTGAQPRRPARSTWGGVARDRCRCGARGDARRLRWRRARRAVGTLESRGASDGGRRRRRWAPSAVCSWRASCSRRRRRWRLACPASSRLPGGSACAWTSSVLSSSALSPSWACQPWCTAPPTRSRTRRATRCASWVRCSTCSCWA